MEVMRNVLEQHLLKPPPGGGGGGRRQFAAVIVDVGGGDGGFGERVPDAYERDSLEAGHGPAMRHCEPMSLICFFIKRIFSLLWP